MGEERIHDLDQLFGKNRPIKVRYEGKLYDLAHPDSFDPVQTNRLQKLQKETDELFSVNQEEMTDEQAEELGRVTEEALEMLNPELNKKISFWHRVNILFFYAEQVKKDAGKNEKKRESSLTGEMSTPD